MADRPPLKITYGVLSFNRKRELDELLKQLVATKAPDSEVLVVDNGSTDGTKELAAFHPHVRWYFNGKNRGVSGGWNDLFKHAEGELVFIFNDDYAVHGGGWESAYITAPKGVLGFPRVKQPLGHEPYVDYLPESRGGRYTHNFRLFGITKALFAAVGPFDEGFMLGYEDTDFNMRAVKLGYALYEMNTDRVYISHLKSDPKWTSEREGEKKKIHAENYQRNTNLFYTKWPRGV